MRPAEVVRRGAGYLDATASRLPGPNAEALMHAGARTSTVPGLYAREEGLSSAEARAYGRALCLRCTGTPLQHLTGEQGFRQLVLTVRPGVFVPRPETEVLVDVALERLDGDRRAVRRRCRHRDRAPSRSRSPTNIPARA